MSTRGAARPASAGIVLWRQPKAARPVDANPDRAIEILLVHPGGPFWAKKDEHGWSIPKGEFDTAGEIALDAARREFAEELGVDAPDDGLIELTPFRAGKKLIHAFLVESDFDATAINPDDTHRSMAEIEWPPRSGRTLMVPEVDRAAWVPLADASTKLHKGQAPLVALVRAALSR